MKLFPHQQEAVDIYEREIAKTSMLKGRFVLPTGAGKTYIQATILGKRLNTHPNSIHLVLAPRIVLLNQLMAEYHEGAREVLRRNIVCHDALTYDFSFGEPKRFAFGGLSAH